MRKQAFKILIVIMLIITCLVPLVSCDAITAQNITNTNSSGTMTNPGYNNRPAPNANQGKNNRPSINGNSQRNNGTGVNGNAGGN